MIKEATFRRPTITRGMYILGESHGSTNDPAFLAFESLGGRPGKVLFERIKRGEITDVNPITSPSRRLIEAFNREAYSRMATTYGFTGVKADREFMEYFFQNQIEEALGVQEHIKAVVPGLSKHTDLSIEVPLDTNLARYVYRLADPNTADTVKAGTRRIILWALTAGDIESRRRMNLGSMVSMIEDDLVKNLCVGKSGEVENVEQLAYHDPRTNDPVAYYDLEEHKWLSLVDHMDSYPRVGFNLKKHPYPVRKTIDGSRVFLDRNSKDKASAILKASRIAPSNGGRIGARGVRDIERMRIVEIDSFDPERRRQQVKSIIKARFGKDVRIKDDDSKNGRVGQSPEVNELRIQVFHRRAPGPFEIVFRHWQDDVRYKTKVGEQNPETGRYDGPADALHELRRTEDILGDYFSGDMVSNEDWDRILRNQHEIVAASLLAEDTVVEGVKIEVEAMVQARGRERFSDVALMA